MSTNELAVIETVSTGTIERTLGNLNARHGISGNQFFSTIKGDDMETKLSVLDAMDNSEPLADHLNETIQVQHIIVSTAEMANEETGVLGIVPRIVVINSEGKAFHAMSGPVLRSVENIFGIVGPQDTWDRPVPVKAFKEGTGNRKYLVLKVDTKSLLKK